MNEGTDIKNEIKNLSSSKDKNNLIDWLRAAKAYEKDPKKKNSPGHLHGLPFM